MRRVQKTADAYLPLEEFVDIPILVKIHWTKNSMAAMIRTEMLEGIYENGSKCYFTSWNFILAALEYRNTVLIKKIVDVKNLPKWGEEETKK